MVVYRKDTSDLNTLTTKTAAQSIEEAANEGEKTSNTTTLMAPRAVLTSRPNSHPFQDRHLTLDQPVKIGRAVARCRALPNNAIFDCKVLSRNHALLWYENGKFYLQDTKSSNGTFINNQRLSKGSEESPAHEVCSGDIVQFGVDVVENSRKVVHGCVVATLRLFLPDGKEAKASPTTTVVLPCTEASISSQELYQLSQYLQEALHREQVLETKLGTLQKVVANTQDESDVGWKALIEEDRLLSRIETLESQLQTCGKNITEEKLKDCVLKLQDDKDKYQTAAKESLKKVIQEKLDAIQKVQDLENSLSSTENECAYLREISKTTEQEMQDLLEKNTNIEKDIVDLNNKIQESEEKYQELLNQSAEDKIEMENKFEEMRLAGEALSAKIEALEAENDFSKEQLESAKVRLQSYKERHRTEGKLEKNGILTPTHDDLGTSGKEITEKEDLIQELFSEMNRLDKELRRVVQENNKNEAPTIEYVENEEHQTNGDVKSSDFVNNLQAEIQQLKKLLAEARENKKVVDSELVLLKNLYDESQNNLKKVRTELSTIECRLYQAEAELQEKCDKLLKLQGEGNYEADSENKKDEPEKKKDANDNEDMKKLQDQFQKKQQEFADQQSETELLKSQVEDMSQELKKMKSKGTKSVEEYNSLQEQCSKHQTTIQALELETKKYQNANTSLKADNSSLVEKCANLQSAKESLENKSGDYWKQQILLANLETEKLNDQLSDALNEIVLVKERYADCSSEMAHLKRERDSINEQLQYLTIKSRVSYAFCIVPIVVLIIAAMMAFYPSLAYLTATSDQT